MAAVSLKQYFYIYFLFLNVCKLYNLGKKLFYGNLEEKNPFVYIYIKKVP